MPAELTPEQIEEKRLADEEAARVEAERVAAEKKKKLDNETEEERVERLVSERLASAKEKLDGAYGKRDAALKELEELKKKERDRELKELEEQGKHKEAYELRLAEQEAKNKVLAEENTRLTRDSKVTAALSGLKFRNDKASAMAHQEITAELVQNEQGLWVHKSGVSIADFAKAYADDEDHAFLFASKNSSGPGLGKTTSSKPNEQGKSLFSLSQDEVLKLAAEGKLPRRN